MHWGYVVGGVVVVGGVLYFATRTAPKPVAATPGQAVGNAIDAGVQVFDAIGNLNKKAQDAWASLGGQKAQADATNQALDIAKQIDSATNNAVQGVTNTVNQIGAQITSLFRGF